MLQGMICIIGIYGLGILLVHAAFGRTRRLRDETRCRSKHYVLISKQNQFQIEWVLRALFLFSWLKGSNFKITVIDEGSTDDTLTIIDKLTKDYHVDLEWLPKPSQPVEYRNLFPSSQTVIVRLSHGEDLQKIALFS